VEDTLKIYRFFVAAMVVCALAGCNSQAPKIGVVNVVKAIDESNPGKAANAELNALVKAKQEQLKVKENGVAAAKKSLGTASTASAKKAAQAQLDKATADYRQLLTASNVQVKQKADQLRGEVLKKLQKVIDTMGQEGNFQLILATANVAYFQKTIDVTDEVIQKFNQASGGK
jgi:Skp family chaperone for outer membrane proteins